MTNSKSRSGDRRVWRMTPEMPMGDFVEPGQPEPAVSDAEAQIAEASKKVLTLPRPPSSRASSYDLMNGCSVGEVDDTIPADFLDDLFGDAESGGR
jgi:hypothetical protein